MISTVPLYTRCNGGGRCQPGRPEVRCVFSSQSDALTLDVPSQTTAWRAVVRVLRSPVDSLSCALFPAPCCACGRPLLRISAVPVCETCWNSLTVESRAWCSLCGEDLGFEPAARRTVPETVRAAPQLCHLCSKVPPPFERAVAFGVYRSTLRSLIHSLKYDGMLPIANGLGQRLAQTILSLRTFDPEHRPSGEMLVVPVPAHRSKRKFNHAELLARATLRELRREQPGWKLTLATDLLERKRVTESQAGLSPHKRRVNVRGAFVAPHPDKLMGADVLLIDDIYTTGATARACTRALLSAGAASVWVATVARAQFEHITRPQVQRFAGEGPAALVDAEELPMEEDVAFWDVGVGEAAHAIVH